MKSGIYRILNCLNGHCYIGSSVNIVRRWKGHLKGLQLGKHGNQRLQRAFDKYGEENFVFEVIEETEDLIAREQFYLDTSHPEYNISPTARNCAGTIHSEENRQRMSAAQSNRSPDTRARISAAHKGKHHSPETRQKLSAINKGKPSTLKGRLHTSDAQLRADEDRRIEVQNDAQLRGNESRRGAVRSEETRQKMSASKKGKSWSVARRNAQETKKRDL